MADIENDIVVKKLCLKEGQYQFTISDSYGDGICCHRGKGYYNVTSYGEVIVQGGEFAFNDTTLFLIPHAFSPMPSALPSFSNV